MSEERVLVTISKELWEADDAWVSVAMDTLGPRVVNIQDVIRWMEENGEGARSVMKRFKESE